MLPSTIFRQRFRLGRVRHVRQLDDRAWHLLVHSICFQCRDDRRIKLYVRPRGFMTSKTAKDLYGAPNVLGDGTAL
jgi:hypothetical protein